MKNKKNWDQLINLILFLPNIDALFLNQSTAQSLQVTTHP